MRGNPRFDAFSESLLHDMGSMEQGALTVFTVYERLQDATLQEALTDDQIFIIRRIMNSPQYNNFIEFLSFQRAEFEIAKGFEEVNTGEKEIWIAASALTYIRKSKFYPLLISTISAEDRALLNRHDIDNVTPSQQKKIDDAYLKNLIKFFDTQLESTSIIEKLDTETAGLLTMYKALGIEAMRGEALLSARTPVPYRASCKSNNAENCINQEWIKSAIAKNEEISATKYRTAALILREKFSDLCTVNSQ